MTVPRRWLVRQSCLHAWTSFPIGSTAITPPCRSWPRARRSRGLIRTYVCDDVSFGGRAPPRERKPQWRSYLRKQPPLGWSGALLILPHQHNRSIRPAHQQFVCPSNSCFSGMLITTIALCMGSTFEMARLDLDEGRRPIARAPRSGFRRTRVPCWSS